jgi:membrane-associated phospholipid phosphatase
MIKDFYKRLIASFALFTIELILAWVLFLACIIVFFYFSAQIRTGMSPSIDQAAFNFAQSIASANVTVFFQTVTFFGSKEFLTPAVILLAVYFLFVRKHRWHSLKVPVIALGSITLNEILKFLYDRPRPIMPLTEASGLSFPSGHTMVAASFYGLLMYLVWTYVEAKPLRNTLLFFLFIAILLIGFSRVYLRVHYASDAIAGFAAGFFWLFFGIWLLKKIEKYTSRKVNQEGLLRE